MIAERNTWITRYQLLLYFVLTYAITIAATLSSSYWPSLPVAVWMIPQIFSPSIVAIILTGAIGGPEAVKGLLLRFVHWKVGLAWYLAAFALAWVPLLFALVYAVLGFPVPGMAPGITPWFLLAQLAYTLYAGPLAEEAGWRGFALPSTTTTLSFGCRRPNGIRRPIQPRSRALIQATSWLIYARTVVAVLGCKSDSAH